MELYSVEKSPIYAFWELFRFLVKACNKYDIGFTEIMSLIQTLFILIFNQGINNEIKNTRKVNKKGIPTF